MAIGGKTIFNAVRPSLIDLVKLAKFKPVKMPTKHGT